VREKTLSYQQSKFIQRFLATLAASLLLFTYSSVVLAGNDSVSQYFKNHPEEITLGKALGLTQEVQSGSPATDVFETIKVQGLDSTGNPIGDAVNAVINYPGAAIKALVGFTAAGFVLIASPTANDVTALQQKAQQNYCAANLISANFQVNNTSSYQWVAKVYTGGNDYGCPIALAVISVPGNGSFVETPVTPVPQICPGSVYLSSPDSSWVYNSR